MSGSAIIIVALAAVAAGLLAAAPQVSEALVRARARRLPARLALRLEEEWLAELRAVSSYPGKIAFALALTFTRRRAFVAPGEDPMTEIHDHPRRVFAAFSGWKALLILPTVFFAMVAYGASFLLPVRYASESLILGFRSTVPPEIVPSLESTPILARANSARSAILSRTNLQALVHEFDLYSKQNVEERIRKIRDDLTVTVTDTESGEVAITLRFVGSDPKKAQEVAFRLTTAFIIQSLEQLESEVLGTRKFLQSQLDRLAARLNEEDKNPGAQPAKGQGADEVRTLERESLRSTYKTVFARLEEVRMA